MSIRSFTQNSHRELNDGNDQNGHSVKNCTRKISTHGDPSDPAAPMTAVRIESRRSVFSRKLPIASVYPKVKIQTEQIVASCLYRRCRYCSRTMNLARVCRVGKRFGRLPTRAWINHCRVGTNDVPTLPGMTLHLRLWSVGSWIESYLAVINSPKNIH